MKSTALFLAITLTLTACATAPKPVQVLQVCPKVPMLELDAPALDFQSLIANFLSGSVEKPLGLKPPSELAKLPTMTSEGK